MRLKQLLCFSLVMLIVLAIVPSAAFAQESLTQKYTSPDGSISFSYPDTWLAGDDGLGYTYYVGSTEGFVKAMEDGETLASGDTGVAIFGTTFLNLIGLDANSSVADIEAIFTEDTSQDSVIGETEIITLGDYEALRIPISSPDGDGNYYAIRAGDSLVLAVGIAFQGEFAQSQATIEAILSSLVVVAPDPNLPASFTEADNSFSFQYPSTFYMPFGYNGQYDTTNDSDTYSYTYNPGAASFTLYTPAGWIEETSLSLSSSNRDIVLALANSARYEYADVPEVLVLGGFSDVTVGDYAGVRLDYSIEGVRDGFALVVDVNGASIGFVGAAAIGKLADFEEQFLNTVASVTYDPDLVSVDGDLKGELPFDTETRSSVEQYGTDLWTFGLEAGEIISIQLLEGIDEHYIELYAPQGIPALPGYYFGDRINFLATRSGTYSLTVSSYASEEGIEYALLVTKAVDSVPFSVDSPASVDITGTTPAFLTFEANAGQILGLSIASDSSIPEVNILAPDGITIPTGYSFSSEIHYYNVMPFTGTYLVTVNGSEAEEAYSLSFSLTELSSIATEIGATVEGEYLVEDQNIFYSFTGNAGDTITLTATSEAFTPHIRLYRNGTEVALGDGYTEIPTATVTLLDDGDYIVSVGTLYDYRTGPFSLSISR